VLSESQQAALLNAVPSFESVWRHWLEEQAEYVQRFPDEALSPLELSREFLWQLDRHLGKRIAAGDTGETDWLFAALEPIYRTADSDLWADLTVGFLESLIYAIEYNGGDASLLHPIQKGPAVESAWRAAFAYIHSTEAEALGWHEV